MRLSVYPVSRSIDVQSPVVSIVEAKKQNINGAIPQRLAERVAAQIFSSNGARPLETLYGVVTTGTDWKFLRMQGKMATIDSDLYYLNNVEKVMGITHFMLNE